MDSKFKQLKVTTGLMLSHVKSQLFKSKKEKYQHDRNYQKRKFNPKDGW